MRAIVILFAFIGLATLGAEGAEQERTTKVPAPHTQIVDGSRAIEVVDLCPQFLDFYQAAVGTDPTTRWRLWGEKYGFAAVPPTPQGKELAHKMLDAAWPRYAKILPLVHHGAASVEPKPQDVLRILRAAGGSFTVGEDTSGTTTYLDLVFPSTDPKTGAKKRELYYVAVTPTMLFAAPRKALIRQAVARLDAKPDAAPAAGILSGTELTHQRSLLPEKLSGLSAADMVQIPWDKVIAHFADEMAKAAKDSTTPPPSTEWLQAVKPDRKSVV